jgi:predicted transcriptional regulator
MGQTIHTIHGLIFERNNSKNSKERIYKHESIIMIMDKLKELLINVGVKKNTATILSLLLDGEARSTREIERAADLRQPETSLALKDLHGFVSVTEQASSEKGRPNKVYRMSKEQGAKYLKQIASEKQKEIDAISANLGKIHEIINRGN